MEGTTAAVTITTLPVSYTHLDVYKRQGIQIISMIPIMPPQIPNIQFPSFLLKLYHISLFL